MTITVWVDAWPILVNFEGTVDIERMSDGVAVAVRPVTKESRVSVVMDEGELSRQREIQAEIESSHRAFMAWWEQHCD